MRAVPVHEVAFSRRGRTGRFWIYGVDERVHAPGLPLSWQALAGSAAAAGLALAAVVAFVARGV